MIKLDLDFIFDNKEPYPEFLQAIQLVNSKTSYKVNTRLRNEVVDAGVFSDFFAGQGTGPGELGLEGFIGLFGEPSEKEAARRGYINPKSAPDAEFTYETAVQTFGKEIADQMREAVKDLGIEGIGVGGNITAELKQKSGLTSPDISLTGRAISRGESGDVQSLEKALKNTTGYDSKALVEWFYNQASPTYRNDVFKIIDQKLANYVSFVYIDKKSKQAIKPQAFVVPNAAKKLNLRDPAKGRQFLSLEYRNGSVNFRINSAGERFLEQYYLDVTTKVMTRISDNFANKMLKYYFTKKGVLRAVETIPKLGKYAKKNPDSIVVGFAELIMFAAQFDPTYGGIPFELETEIQSAAGFGAIKSKSRGRLSTKRKLRDPMQQQISLLQIQQLAKRLIRQAMPTGIDRFNPPPRPDILTYRTGRLFDSIKLTQWSQKTNIIKYTYDPIYEVYQDEARSVDTLVQEKGLRPAVQQLFGQKYFRFQRVGVKR